MSCDLALSMFSRNQYTAVTVPGAFDVLGLAKVVATQTAPHILTRSVFRKGVENRTRGRMRSPSAWEFGFNIPTGFNHSARVCDALVATPYCATSF